MGQHQVVANAYSPYTWRQRTSAWGSEYYELSIHVMQAGKSNWGLEISMGPLLFRSQGFPVHHLPRGKHWISARLRLN
jgi:hypothetical protein